MTRKSRSKTSNQGSMASKNSSQSSTRMLARCVSCMKDYMPRGRGGLEIGALKLFYLPHDKLAPDKGGLICPMHKDKKEPAGLIISEDCLTQKYGFAMGMIGFSFNEDEIAAARRNLIWPRMRAKIELDVNMLSSLSDEQILKVIKQIKSEVQDSAKNDHAEKNIIER